MKQYVKYILPIIITYTLFFSSCKKQFGDPNWDVDVLAPLLKTTVTLDQIIEDSIKQVNADSSISLVYQNEIYRFNLDSLYSIPDTSVEYTAKLSSLDLGTISVSTRHSLGDIANYDFDINGPTGDLYQTIMTGHNTGTPSVIDNVDQQVYDDLQIDATDYFQTATIQSGYIDIEFDNDMPIDFTNIILELKNEVSGIIVVQDTFTIIPAFGNDMHTKSLNNVQVEGSMIGTVKFESPGSAGAVAIDTSMAITASITVRDLSIESATAIFPTQDIVNQGETTSFTANDIQLSEVIVKQGDINIIVYNTIEEPIHYNYTIPGALLNGNQLEISGTVPAASGVPGQTTIQKNLAGYSLDLKGIGPIEQAQGTDLNNNGFYDADTINTLYYTLTGRIDSSGNLISLSLDDSVYVRLDFSGIVPLYGKGYLGQEQVNVTGSETMDIFDDILDGTMDLDDVKISLSVSNQIGAEGGIQINSLISKNSKTGAQSNLIIPSQFSPFIINKPYDPHTIAVPVTPVISTMYLDANNSNPDELVEIMPDMFSYDLNFTVNPNTAPPYPGTGTDFIYYDSEVIASLDVELPLSLIASNITLVDTSGFKLNESDVEDINQGKLTLYADNQFPLNAVVQLYMLDDIGNLIDSLLPSNTTIEAGYYNHSTGMVDTKRRTKIEVMIPESRLTDLVNTKKMKLVTRFTSNPYGEFVKIYSRYNVDFVIVGDFSYHID